MNYFVGFLYISQDELGIGRELYLPAPHEQLRTVLQGCNKSCWWGREGDRERESEKQRNVEGVRYRDTRKKQLASVDSEDSRSDKKPDDRFGATRTHAVFTVPAS